MPNLQELMVQYEKNFAQQVIQQYNITLMMEDVSFPLASRDYASYMGKVATMCVNAIERGKDLNAIIPAMQAYIVRYHSELPPPIQDARLNQLRPKFDFLKDVFKKDRIYATWQEAFKDIFKSREAYLQASGPYYASLSAEVDAWKKVVVVDSSGRNANLDAALESYQQVRHRIAKELFPVPKPTSITIMNLLYVLDHIPNPLNDRMDIWRPKLGIPYIRYRGGELGKFQSSLTENGYVGTYERDPAGGTFCAYTLYDALSFAMTRTNEKEETGPYKSYVETRFEIDMRGKGGRYDSATGTRIEGYQYGFPFLIAINTEPYTPDRIRADKEHPNKVYIKGPIKQEDILILFDNDINWLRDIIGLPQSQIYLDLLNRQKQAKEETR